MNGLHRRLLKAFVQGGGDLGDGPQLDRFAALVRTNVLLLTARTRRAVELVLEGGEEISYDDIANDLARQEGRAVSVASVRQRISRGGRQLEAAVRRSSKVAAAVGAPIVRPQASRSQPHFGTPNGRPVAAGLVSAPAAR